MSIQNISKLSEISKLRRLQKVFSHGLYFFWLIEYYMFLTEIFDRRIYLIFTNAIRREAQNKMKSLYQMPLKKQYNNEINTK